jgi:hypothetical protein
MVFEFTRCPEQGYRPKHTRVCGAVYVLILVFAAAPVYAEQLSLASPSWNGLSELLAIAKARGEVLTPPQLDVASLGAADALLIIHPTVPLPVPELARFLRKGGRLAVADDFGTGQTLFSAFGMGMRPPSPGSRSLRGNPQLLLATPLSGHPLADGADALVTNHPQVIYHPDLRPVFALVGSHGAVVLSGAVGKGRLVAISDASVLINNMLEFPGNRALANNLVQFLHASPGTRIFVADSTTLWSSGFRQLTTGNPLARVAAALAQLAKPQLPSSAVLALSIVLAAVLLAAAVSALPRRSAYARRAYLRTPECMAGMAGRVHYYTGLDRNYLGPLLVLKLELERRLVALVHASGQIQRDELLQALRAAGWQQARVTELAGFMQRVDQLQDGSVATDTRVSSRQFSELVAAGRRILAELEAAAGAYS